MAILGAIFVGVLAFFVCAFFCAGLPQLLTLFISMLFAMFCGLIAHLRFDRRPSGD